MANALGREELFGVEAEAYELEKLGGGEDLCLGLGVVELRHVVRFRLSCD